MFSGPLVHMLVHTYGYIKVYIYIHIFLTYILLYGVRGTFIEDLAYIVFVCKCIQIYIYVYCKVHVKDPKVLMYHNRFDLTCITRTLNA